MAFHISLWSLTLPENARDWRNLQAAYLTHPCAGDGKITGGGKATLLKLAVSAFFEKFGCSHKNNFFQQIFLHLEFFCQRNRVCLGAARSPRIRHDSTPRLKFLITTPL